ncbi:lipoate--protein ligase family protein [Cupriavidus sp. MP-37]|uniref:lipoyl protein ligase domain-containing protein n=1 Tax=Cupriavidus sp. MP-37 TaxID=2884455 RepID=UPI001D0BD7DD|nr:lipoate--protein ligase family protein [Cupriavidus sp. MP-37]UDM52132.1 lipoate--protein ligase family protein [Cupriavidus sp. MP-37]
MPFGFVETIAADHAGTDPLQEELALLELAAQGRHVAQLWEAPLSLVVPRTYLRHAALEGARADFARQGCPVFLRMSGGGLVPQGPGILNLSLAYPVGQPPGALSDAVYLHLCAVIGGALRKLGIETHWQAVAGSFCDGRYNLAWGPPEAARKIAGTAQYWRRAPAAMQAADGQRHLVLAHAVLLVSADPGQINARANAFEAAIGSERRYDADKVVSVREALVAGGHAARDDAALMAAVADALRWSLGQHPAPA